MIIFEKKSKRRWTTTSILSIFTLGCLLCSVTQVNSTNSLFECPEDWELHDFYCYRFYGIRHSWKTAAEICKRYGSELLVVDEAVQNNFTQSLAAQELRDWNDKSYWIGLHTVDNLKTNSLESSSGNFISKYSGFWTSKQPKPQDGDCVESNYADNVQSWTLTTCEKLMPFFCRYKACPKGSYHCSNGKCINANFRCDGDNDCGDRSDEIDCPKLCHFHQKVAGDSIESPGFPKKYEPNLDCKWTLEGPVGYSIMLQFFDFSTEENFDTVQILTGGKTEETSVNMYTLSGKPSNTSKIFSSASNLMIVKFRTDASVEKTGFRGSWKIEPSGCGADMTASPTPQTFTSPKFPDPYPGGLECQYTITAPQGKIITLEFLEFDMEPDDDFLLVRDGLSSTGTQLARLTGSLDTIPRFIMSTSNKMYLYLRTNYGDSRKGFRTRYRAGCIVDLESNSSVIYSPAHGVTNYPNNLDCIYNIKNPKGGPLSLKFGDFQLDNNDLVQVYDGPNTSGVRLHPEKGFTSRSKVDMVLTATSGKMTVRFVSDPLRTARGWTATFSSDCPPMKIGKGAIATTRDHYFGTKVTFTCPPGYEFHNNKSKIISECEIGGKWSVNFVPDCQVRYCGPVPQIDNGFAVNATNVTYLGAITYQCYAGFVFRSGRSTESVTCTANGEWEELPVCVTSECPPLPGTPHAVTKVLNGGNSSYGTIVRFECEDGYYRIGLPVIVCMTNGSWSGSPPLCRRKTCFETPAIANGFIAEPSKEYLFGDRAFVQCYRGYKLQGSKAITCGPNETFTNLPTCEDINECAAQACDLASTDCMNTPGAFFCKCKDGFTPNLDCRPIGDLGLSTGVIPDVNIQVSGTEHGYDKTGVRLNSAKSWCGSSSKAGENWIMIDLMAPTILHSFRTQPAKRIDGGLAFASQVRIQYTNELNDVFRDYTTSKGEIFDFRYDASAGAGIPVFELPKPLEARYLKFVIAEYVIAPCTRLELMGCSRQDCQDSNECQKNNGGCDHRCSNSAGGFSCSCNNGYELYTANGTAGFNIPLSESGTREGDRYMLNKTCVPKMCPTVSRPENGLLLSTKTKFHFGDVVNFQCNFGYVMEGNPTISCSSAGTWNATPPVCNFASCDPIKDNPSDSLVARMDIEENGTIPYGQNETFQCSETGRRLMQAVSGNFRQCVYDPKPVRGTYWMSGTTPACERLDCGIPEPSPGVVISRLRDTKYGATFPFECEPNFQLSGRSDAASTVVQCTEDGIWDFGDLTCEGPVCQDPGHPPDGIQKATSYEQGAETTFSCLKPGYIPIISSPISCVRDPVCKVIKPLGITSGLVPDAAINATSERRYYEAQNVRMNSATGWCGQQEPLAFVSVDLGKVHWIKSIFVKGVVTNDVVGRPLEIRLFYKVRVNEDFVVYFPNFNLSTRDPGNYGELALINLPESIQARYVILGIVSYDKNPCLKFELMGCEIENERPLLGYEMGYPWCVDSEPPQFVNCPSEPVMVNRTSDGLQPVNFIEPTAVDNSGRIARFEIHPPFFKSPATVFENTLVEYIAYDFDGNVAICDITIIVPDDVPPSLSCPPSFITEVTVQQEFYEVFFNESELHPVAYDRSNVTNIVFDPPSANISVGTFQNVTVTATDRTGNKAVCYFQAAVNAAPCASWSLKPPANGNLSCLPSGSQNGLSCVVACDNGYRFVDGEPTKIYTCQDKDQWSPGPTVPDCVPVQGRQAAYDVVPKVIYRPFGALSGSCRDAYVAQISKSYASLGSVLSQRCSSINVDMKVDFHNTIVNISSENDISIDFILRVDPAVKQPLIYDLCGSTLGLIFDLTVPGTNIIIESLLNVTAEGQCPGIQAKHSSISRGFTCNKGEILIKENGQIVPQCLACPSGTFASDEQKECIECSRGYYQEEVRQAQCKRCPSGSYTRFNGTKKMNDCIPVCGWGTYSATGLIPCLQCPLDTYSGTPPVDGFKECQACPKQKYTYQPGASHISECRAQCAPGHYSGTGLEPCAECPLNFYQPFEGQVECSQCNHTLRTAQAGSDVADLCLPVDCQRDYCENGGLCVVRFHQPRCLCPAGLTGARCEATISECASNPCYNEGKCTDSVRGHTCSCPEGYSGLNCEIENDECAISSCPPNSMCQNLPGIGNTRCLCRTGFTGPSCNVTIDPCMTETNKCANGATCIPLKQGRYTCSCPSGWSGHLCEINIDDCEQNPCLVGANCTDLVNDFKCDCPQGFTGKRCHIKVDMCKPIPCANGICVDRIFYSECICNPGWTGSNCDININDCASSPCANHSQCVDQVDGFKCQCERGYTGSFCQHTIDYCGSNPCQNAGTCTNHLEGFTCECRPGFVGIQCEVVTDECSSNPCDAAGSERCLDLDNNFKCNCLVGFTGELCETNIDDCKTNPCMNGGTCKDGINTYTCLCPSGWTGDNCQKDVSSCVSSPCMNHATCVDLFQDYFCICPSGTDGKRCQTAPQRCIGNPCLNGGNCQDFGSGLNCTCSEDFTGVGCQYNHDTCERGLCKNGATCEDFGLGFKCNCPPGFTGKYCDRDIPDCTPTSCPPTAICVDLTNDFLCKCPENSTGEDCRKSINIDYDIFINSRSRISFASLAYPFSMRSSGLTVALWVQFIVSDESGPFFTLYSVDSLDIPINKKTLMQIQGNGVRVTLFPDQPEIFIPYVTTITVMDGQWHHVAIVWDGVQATVTLVVDAVLVGTFPEYAQGKQLPLFGYVTLGSPFNADEQSSSPRDPGFHGYISRVNIWDRALDVSVEIPMQVRSCKNAPELFNGALLRWSGYDIIEGNIEKISPGSCGQRTCKPGFSGINCEKPQRDKEPPTVVFCPSDVWAEARNGSAIVEWPLPKFSDNFNVTDVKESNNYAPGQVFLWGTYELAYVASDAAGNLASCEFKIYVRPEFCSKPQDPLGGSQRCSSWGPKGRYKMCTIQCSEGSEFSQPVPSFYTCGPEGYWRPSLRPELPLVYPGCSRSYAAQRIFKMKLNFPSSVLCSDSGTKIIKNKVIEGLTKLNREWRVCSSTEPSSGSCGGLNVKVACNKQVLTSRNRRSTETTEAYDLEVRFPSVNDPVTNVNNNQPSTVQNVVESLVFESGAFDVRDALPNVVADPTSLDTASEFDCPTGKVVVPPKCVDCAPGTFYESSSKQCIPCPIGAYQNDAAQLACKHCPSIAGKQGVTAMLGARSVSGCKERCSPGKYYEEGAGLCRSCGHGFYQPDEGKFRCLPCSFGLTTRTAEATSIQECREDCGSGQEIGLSGNCEPCRQGFYRTKGKSIGCVPCPDETTTVELGSVSIADCVLPKCKAGTHLNTTLRVCSPCQKGTYQNESLQLSCISCPNKTTTLNQGSSGVEQCVNPCDLIEKSKMFCDTNALCDFKEGTENHKCICNPGYTGNGTYCSYMCDNYCGNEGKCRIDKHGDPICECKGYYHGPRCEEKSEIAYIAGGIAGAVGLIIIVVLLICMICYRVNKKKEPKKVAAANSDHQSQINFYYGTPAAPYAESIAPSHHSTYAHYYDDDDDGWEMPNFYNETYMKEGLHNGKHGSTASLYGNKDDLYDRLRRHAYQGKKGDSDSDDQAR
ncbi:hypothetical protein CHUAL_002455 [Chamberlinius hualienensis]